MELSDKETEAVAVAVTEPAPVEEQKSSPRKNIRTLFAKNIIT